MNLSDRIKLIDDMIRENAEATIVEYDELVRDILNIEKSAGKDIVIQKLMEDLFGRERMLALSWKQPFATAMLANKDETRVWPTTHRGLVLICTSLQPYSEHEVESICGSENYIRMCRAMEPFEETIGLNGYAIGVGRLKNCRGMMPEDEEKTYVQYRAPWVEEREGKDGIVRKFAKRLYSHIYTDVRPIVPFKWKGCQGWSEVSEEIKKQIQYV